MIEVPVVRALVVIAVLLLAVVAYWFGRVDGLLEAAEMLIRGRRRRW